MRTYEGLIRSNFGPARKVRIDAYTINDAREILEEQWGANKVMDVYPV